LSGWGGPARQNRIQWLARLPAGQSGVVIMCFVVGG
jgi:hypothetical protein